MSELKPVLRRSLRPLPRPPCDGVSEIPTASSTASSHGSSSTAACWRNRQRSRHPLLERVRFLSISAANLDEFFMVRVAGPCRPGARGHRCAAPTAARPSSSSEQILLEVETACRRTSREALSDLCVLAARRRASRASRPTSCSEDELALAGRPLPGADILRC